MESPIAGTNATLVAEAGRDEEVERWVGGVASISAGTIPVDRNA